MTPADGAAGIPHDDIILPFQIDPFALRGRVVRLGAVVDTILGKHDYPRPVRRILAEALALAAALAATLKFDGVFTLQTRSDGPIRMIVADVTSAGSVRGYAQFDADKLAALGTSEEAMQASVPRLLGAGYLAFTVDQGTDMERYQGIVDLDGATLAECAHHYFRQSEQLETGIKIAAAEATGEDGRPAWRAGALMIQRLAPEGAQGSAEGAELDQPLTIAQEAAEDGWRTAMVLMGSATSAELVNPALPAWMLVDRLFRTEGVKIYRPQALVHACRCSRERVAQVLRSLPRTEVEALKVDGRVEVTCEFCNARHDFDAEAVDGLFAEVEGGAS